MNEYLIETSFLDYSSSIFDDFSEDIPNYLEKKELAIHLYLKVRESFLYDPYHLDLRHDSLKASYVLRKKRAWCVEKAIVLAALARKFNIPSRLGYAIVVNHIGVEKLTSYLRRPEIVFHGYVELFVNQRWVKCTPSFDSRICRISNVSVLDWDGENDSLFQPFQGDLKFMEYIHDYGIFSDVPIEFMNTEMQKYYPHLFESKFDSKEFSFHHL
jgi:transglutaminase-like putative cysteine protease